MDTDTFIPDPSPWTPESDPMRLKVLGKAAEEVNELGSALARCIIQGIDQQEPVTKKLNSVWLEDEIADVEAQIALLKERFQLDRTRIAKRRDRKYDYALRWLHGLTRPAEQ